MPTALALHQSIHLNKCGFETSFAISDEKFVRGRGNVKVKRELCVDVTIIPFFPFPL